jgi:hypothetical protein
MNEKLDRKGKTEEVWYIARPSQVGLPFFLLFARWVVQSVDASSPST